MFNFSIKSSELNGSLLCIYFFFIFFFNQKWGEINYSFQIRNAET